MSIPPIASPWVWIESQGSSAGQRCRPPRWCQRCVDIREEQPARSDGGSTGPPPAGQDHAALGPMKRWELSLQAARPWG